MFFKQFLPILFLFLISCSRSQAPGLPARESHYSQTSTYDEVMKVAQYVANHSDHTVLNTFGESEQGKPLPLLIFSDRLIHSPEEARSLNRPVILVLGDIHSGEVDGKEAMLRIAMNIEQGKYAALLNKITVLFAPIYNPDGNDMMERTHRTNQNGPSEGVGTRTNAVELNLNRDFTKLDASESVGLVTNVLNTWDPVLFMDLHTTDGSYHGYHLTYAPPLNPNTDPEVIQYERGFMLPAITQMMKEQGWNTNYYGFFESPTKPNTGWRTFSPLPRYSTNYYGLRNRLALLAETYSYLDFKHRIDVSEDFVLSTLRYSADHASELLRLKKKLDSLYEDYPGDEQEGVEFDYAPPVKDTILVGSVDTVYHKDIDRMTFRRLDTVRKVRTNIYGRFRATKKREVPVLYGIPDVRDKYDDIFKNLQEHGIRLFKTSESDDVMVKRYIPEQKSVIRSYEQHQLIKVDGKYIDEKINPKSWILIPTDNVKRNLIFYLLEPESDDGYVRWNFFGDRLSVGDPFPIVKIMYKPGFKIQRLSDSSTEFFKSNR